MISQVDELPIKSIHHVEFWVGNAKQAEYFYRNAFGFERIAYSGPETGVRDRASYVLKQGKIRFVFTSPMGPDGEISEHIKRHGDGVRDIAFEVESADKSFKLATERGGVSASEPHEVSDGGGAARMAAIHTYGDTIHSFVEKNGYQGPFLPKFEANVIPGQDVGLLKVDHIVGNVELGKMDEWAKFYEDVFGFYRFKSFDDKDISTEFTALMSKVMSNGSGLIKFPLNEPAPGRKKSQIEEYLDFYTGPGVQHIALLTGDILATVAALRDRGVDFLYVPETYYGEVKERIGQIQEDFGSVQSLGILIDRDEEGYLLQLFTKPVEDRPTLFFEIIQRRGSQSFGKGNFKALFEAIEREQERRGNL
ncbi:MAG: 4-hydroxyphenylpyruvate dioxygenase [Candidatus Eisenbacteria bacterium]|uniref:4-hydroxyphenylpyruvate dioxygenase n=1 Tax=Eiseniibacteriota bacterium TaxID=2212470 RepID=A0A7Y2E887_UNCEI|nr:4-hydroxyphenylpyruvate dioxygenase [Candidatus Eisenbacteria bacterium]